MVRAVSLVVIGNPEPVQSDLQIAIERDGHVRRPEGRHDLELCRLQHRRSIETEQREPLKLIASQIVDIGIIAGVEARQTPAVPVRVAATKLLGLNEWAATG